MDSSKTINIHNFMKLSDELLDLGVFYVSLLIMDRNNSIILSECTNKHWEQFYVNNNCYKDCHIIRSVVEAYSKNDKNFTFLWDVCYPDNEISAYIDNKRRENKISHGVAFCNMIDNNFKQIITVASVVSDVNFGLKVLENKKIFFDTTAKLLFNRKS